MNYKRNIGLVLFLCGVALIFISFYIKNEVASGRTKILSGERQIESGKKLFSLNPITEEIGNEVTRSAEGKIRQGKHDIAYYESLSNILMISGIILIVIGSLIFILGKKKSKS